MLIFTAPAVWEGLQLCLIGAKSTSAAYSWRFSLFERKAQKCMHNLFEPIRIDGELYIHNAATPSFQRFTEAITFLCSYSGTAGTSSARKTVRKRGQSS